MEQDEVWQQEADDDAEAEAAAAGTEEPSGN
jgi:hypothetical protein